MRVAVVGSRTRTIETLESYLPPDTTEIVSGGARGIDQCAREYARQAQLPCTEFLPDYPRYGRAAALKRNDQIVACADYALIFWDGKSRGTAYVIRRCRQQGVPHRVVIMA